MKDFTLSAVQMACSENTIDNLNRCKELIEFAKDDGADIVCLQELFCYSYFAQKINRDYFKLAEPIPGKITDSIGETAQNLGLYIIVPIFEKEMNGVYYNSAVLISSNGKIIGKYRKNHIPDEPLYYEKYYFKPGNLNYPIFETPFVKIGIGICWDQWFPETGRILALNGAELIVFPTAIAASYHAPDQWNWERMLNEWLIVNQAQASMNKVFLAAANRVGKEGDMDFFGNSIICNPVGEIINRAGRKECVISARIQKAILQETRELWPFFRDRRENTYERLIK